MEFQNIMTFDNICYLKSSNSAVSQMYHCLLIDAKQFQQQVITKRPFPHIKVEKGVIPCSIFIRLVPLVICKLNDS
jgi:hypothetical protein